MYDVLLVFLILTVELIMSYVFIVFFYYSMKMSHHKIISILLIINLIYILISVITLWNIGLDNLLIIYFLYSLSIQYCLYSVFLLTVTSLRFKILAKENLSKYENIIIDIESDRLSDLIKSGIIVKVKDSLSVRKSIHFYYLFLIFFAKMTFNIHDDITYNMKKYINSNLIQKQ
jgi:hypothetical protein